MRSRKPILFIDCEIIINTFQCFDINSRQDLKKSQFGFNPISVTLFFVSLQRIEINLQIKKNNPHEENITTRIPMNVTGAVC